LVKTRAEECVLRRNVLPPAAPAAEMGVARSDQGHTKHGPAVRRTTVMGVLTGHVATVSGAEEGLVAGIAKELAQPPRRSRL
jgi:hypothetical protein